MEKTCKKCGETKAIELFKKDKTCKYGRGGTCKYCIAKDRKKWRLNNPEAYKESYTKQNNKPINKAKKLERNKIWRKTANGKAVMKKSILKWKLNNPEKYKESYKGRVVVRNPEEQIKFREKRKLYLRKYSKTENGKIKIKINHHNWYNRNKAIIKENDKLERENLSDAYIKKGLKDRGFPVDFLNNPDLIEAKRLIIKTKRLCKTSKKCANN